VSSRPGSAVSGSDPDTGRPATAVLLSAWLVACGYLGYAAWAYYAGYRDAARGGIPLFTDFTPNYAASLLLQDEPAERLFDRDRIGAYHLRAAQAAYADRLAPEQTHIVGNTRWMYPPTFNLYLAPLAQFPYLTALLLWTLLTALLYLAPLTTILPARLALPLALAAPPAFFNLMYGQTGFLTAGLLALGLCHLRGQPLLAGVLIGLASFKPHLGVLIPVALLAGGYWRSFASAALTVAGGVAVSALVYGTAAWLAFLGSLGYLLDGFAANAYNFMPMTSVLATLALAGVPVATAWLVQYAAAGLMVVLVAACWWRGRARPDTLGLQAAIVCCATPLALPMVFLYDLCLLVPAVAWTWRQLPADGAGAAERAALLATLGAFLAVKAVAESVGLQLGALLVALLLAQILRRYRLALALPQEVGR